VVERLRPDAIVHAAAQPSHDRAAAIPFDDFDTNAGGTINLLEAARRFCPEAPFVHMSTNKVYGDAPNELAVIEFDKRWDYADSVELHGFLSYLVKCNLENRHYTVSGYKGKQVRDNIHSHDVARFIHAFITSPRPGEVYNIGGGRQNSCSILEAFERVERLTGKPMQSTYDPHNREGDRICYMSNLAKARAHYPDWDLTKSLDDIFEEVVAGWSSRTQFLVTVTSHGMGGPAKSRRRLTPDSSAQAGDAQHCDNRPAVRPATENQSRRTDCDACRGR